MKKRTLVAGIFNDADAAVDAIHELRRTSFSDDQLGFVVRYETNEQRPNLLARCIVDNLPGVRDILFQHPAKKALTGMIINCVIGGTLGAVATLQFPAIGPVIAGGIMAATLATADPGGITAHFLSLGISEHNVPYYEQQFLAGSIIFFIDAAEQPQDAQDILQYHGACNIEAY